MDYQKLGKEILLDIRFWIGMSVLLHFTAITAPPLEPASLFGNGGFYYLQTGESEST